MVKIFVVKMQYFEKEFSHSYLPFDSVDIYTTHCAFFENLKRQFCFYDGILGSVYFFDFQYSIGGGICNILTKKSVLHSHKLSAMADNYPVDWCINCFV